MSLKPSQLPFLIILPILVVDQLIKLWVKTHMMLHESIEVAPWFQIVFTENRGMAFGMTPVATHFLAAFRIVAIAGFIYLLYRAVRTKASLGMTVSMSLIVAGALGNLIDNTFYGLIFSESLPQDFGLFGADSPATLVPFGTGYADLLTGRVVDMFYFPFFTWPESLPLIGGDVFFGAIFNFADAAITVGAFALAICYYKAHINAEKKSVTNEATSKD